MASFGDKSPICMAWTGRHTLNIAVLKADFTKDMIDNIKSSVGYQVFFVVQHVLNDSFGLI